MQYFHGETELHLTEEAQLTGTSDSLYYRAPAKDINDNDYEITWEITAEDLNALEDESMACDWEKYNTFKY